MDNWKNYWGFLLAALVVGGGLYWAYRRRMPASPEALGQACTEVERDAYKLIRYTIEACTSADGSTIQYFGKIEVPLQPVKRSQGFPAAELAKAWVRATIDGYQNASPPPQPPGPFGQAPTMTPIPGAKAGTAQFDPTWMPSPGPLS